MVGMGVMWASSIKGSGGVHAVAFRRARKDLLIVASS